MAAVFVGFNIAWVWINRHGGAVNIDEAGYIGLSVNDYRVLTHEGLRALFSNVADQAVQPPLVTLLGATLYPVVGGPSILGSYTVELLAYLWTVILAFLIVRQLSGSRAALVAALLVGSTPIALDYVHEYSFAVPAAAALTTAAWAGLRSQHMTSLRWSGVWGAALGAMVLSRSMTIAFVPAFLLLAILHVCVSGRWRRSLAGVGVGGAAGFVIAGPWYLAQGGSVWGYLTSFGFGAQSTLYGTARSPLSLTSWLGFVSENVNAYLWLPLTLFVLAGGLLLVWSGIAAVVRAWPGHVRGGLSSPWLYLSVIVAAGLVALESSRNTGSAFLAPLTPIMVALGVAALFRWIGSRGGQAALVAAAVVIGASIWTAKMAFNGPSGVVVSVSLPAIGPTTVLDGRSEFDLYATGEVDPGDPAGRRWVAANKALVSRIELLTPPTGGVPRVVFATNDRMLNVNTFRLDQALAGGREFDVTLLSAASGNDARNYVAQLQTSPPRDTFLILRFAARGEFPPVVNQTFALQAAQSLGFHQAARVPLPDGTALDVWER